MSKYYFLIPFILCRASILSILIIFNIFAEDQNRVVTEEDLKSLFVERMQNPDLGLDPIEGIWSESCIMETYASTVFMGTKNDKHDIKNYPLIDRIAIFSPINNRNIFTVHIITPTGVKSNIYMVFNKTAAPGVYFVNDTNPKYPFKANAILKENSILKYMFEINENKVSKNGQLIINVKKFFNYTLIKEYPTKQDINESVQIAHKGTGFAISEDGLIATNYHVVEGSKSILITGVQGCPYPSCSAEVILKDVKNDLAILKVKGECFKGFSVLPYRLQDSVFEAGEGVFTMGYPLTDVMGDEIKLTSGIISAKTGFQDDITCYQISVPLQPGNSGGPLFNEDGEIIGIVNAKYLSGENVSYAIKTGYLFSLISVLPKNITIGKINTLKGKKLSEKAKLIKSFVYIIEVK